MDYKKRIIDDQLDLKLESFGATLIVGPKGCGKTTSAKQKAKSFFEISRRKATRKFACGRQYRAVQTVDW